MFNKLFSDEYYYAGYITLVILVILMYFYRDTITGWFKSTPTEITADPVDEDDKKKEEFENEKNKNNTKNN